MANPTTNVFVQSEATERISSLRNQDEDVSIRVGQVEIGGRNLNGILVEDGFEPTIYSGRALTIVDRWGGICVVGLQGDSSATMLDRICTHHRYTLNADFYESETPAGLQPIDIPIVLLTQESYRSVFTPETTPPAWAGCCIRGGKIVYSGDYINAVLCGDGKFGGYSFSPAYFNREHLHELSHQDLDVSVFSGNEDMIDHFSNNSNWVFEGLAELVPGISQSSYDFRTNLMGYMRKFSNFSSQELGGDFFHIDGRPAGVNFAYQYSARLIRRLAPILSQLDYRRTRFLNTKPYGATVGWWVVARNRYLEGRRESFTEAVENEAGVKPGLLRSVELQWRDDVLKGVAD